MTITADYDTLMLQAASTAELYFDELSRKYRDVDVPPEVMAAMIHAAAIDMAASCISVSIQELTEQLVKQGDA